MSNLVFERPIPYSDAMMLARLDGRKTQTRRTAGLKAINENPDAFRLIEVVHSELPSVQHTVAVLEHHDGHQVTVKCPFGKPGSDLWPREAWRIERWDEETGQIAVTYRADGRSSAMLDVPDDDLFTRYWEQSSDDAARSELKADEDDQYHWEAGQSPCRGRPPMFMPRFASRGLDRIVDIRLERLHDISEEDARAEGVSAGEWVEHKGSLASFAVGVSKHADTAREAFCALWESINGPGSWQLNEWLWVIQFKVVR